MGSKGYFQIMVVWAVLEFIYSLACETRLRGDVAHVMRGLALTGDWPAFSPLSATFETLKS